MQGVLRVTTGNAVWIVPSSHVVWIPGGHLHQMMTATAATNRILYVDERYPVRDPASGCCVLLLTPLMRELLLRLGAADAEADPAAFARLGRVAIDEIGRLESAPLNLPGGRDARLRRLIDHVLREPDEACTLAQLTRVAGASLRTLERLFRDETGMTFRQWRARLRLLGAIDPLAQGHSSTAIAYTLGFRSASAFVAAFRQNFGCAPQQFLRNTGIPPRPAHPA